MNKLSLLALILPGFVFANEFVDDMPMNPDPGKCYARVVVPAKYKSTTEKMMVKPEMTAFKTVPAKYELVSEKVLVKEATEKSFVVPATYKTVKEKMMIEDEKRVLVPTAAVYKNVSKKILVKPEGYEWKKGKGALQKIDNATGEILCYTKTPAVYKTVNERVLVKEASVQERVIPAKYGWVTKTVEATPEQIKKKMVPAVYKTVKVKKMVTPPKEVKKTTPAVFKTITKKKLVEDSFTQWQPILCQTNTNKTVIRQLQKSLASMGLYKGGADGNLGPATMKAVQKYQNKNGLATGGLTEETLNKLSINL